MQALNAKDSTEDLRYEKVILATAADVDGRHIRNLMIKYFFRFFEQFVHDGHVYVLDAPLFRARTGKSGSHQEKTTYCCSETECDNAVKELGGKPAYVAEATDETEATEPSESKAKSTVQHTTARRRPEITGFKGLGEISPLQLSAE